MFFLEEVFPKVYGAQYNIGRQHGWQLAAPAMTTRALPADPANAGGLVKPTNDSFFG